MRTSPSAHLDVRGLVAATILGTVGALIIPEADAQGRVVVPMGCIQTVGLGLGPANAALILCQDDFSPVIWMSIGVLVFSLLVVIGGLKVNASRAAPFAAPGST